MADGRQFENKQYIGRTSSDFHQTLHDDEDIGANLNFSQKLKKYEKSKMADGRLFEKRKYTITRPCIVRPNYIYIYTTCHRAGLSASAELLVTCQMPYLLPNQQCQVKTVRLQQQHYKNHSRLKT